MTVGATLESGDVAPIPDASAIPAFIYPSEIGAGSVFQFNPSDDVYASTGASDGEEGTLWFLRNAGVPCVVAVCAGTPGTKSAVSHSGSGPTVTAGYTGSASAPLLTTSFMSKVLTGGVNGAALLGYCLDGSADYAQYTATVPTEGPSVLLGTVPLTNTIAASLDTLTLVFTAPASLTVTFAAPVTPQDVADQIVAQAITGSKVNRAEIYQDSTGSYLRLYTTTLGTSVTQTIDAATSTGEAILGFTSGASNLTKTGTAATLPIAFTGITLTFASGTYVAADTYSFTTTGPTASTAAIATACDNLRASGYPFGYVLPLLPTTNASNTAGLCAALDAKVVAWDVDTEAPIYPFQVTPGPFHVASATPATNATNIATVDQALLAAFASQVSIGTVVPGDGYATGSKVSGSYRRSAALGVAYMLSAFKLSDDPGAATHGSIPEWSLVHPDTVTLARDQANPRTVNKLGGSTGPGFTVLRTVNKGTRVVHGVTRAGAQSRLVDLGPGLRMGRRAQVVLYDTAKNGIENETFATDAAGKLLEAIRRALEGVFFADLSDAILTPPLNNNASSVSVVIDSAEKIANTKNVSVKATLQKLGVAENVTIRAIVAGTVVSTTLAG